MRSAVDSVITVHLPADEALIAATTLLDLATLFTETGGTLGEDGAALCNVSRLIAASWQRAVEAGTVRVRVPFGATR